MNDHLLTRYTLILLFLFLFFGAFYLLRTFLIPVSIAALLAMLMLPVCKKLIRWGINHALSVIICIFIIFLAIGSIIYLLSSQVAMFIEDAPLLQDQILSKIEDVQSFVKEKFNIPYAEQGEFIRKRLGEFAQTADTFVKDILVATTGTLVMIALIIIYIFFFIYYRKKFTSFVLKITPVQKHERAGKIITQVSGITQRYLSGVFIVVIILAIMNSIVLISLGIKHAVFFALLAAILNIVPYIGVVIGSTLPALMALLTKDSIWYALGVVALFSVNQFIENNFLTPNITGSHVRLNPLATIMALIFGGLLWGVAGMILFIPFLGIVKIIFDNVENLKPYGYLLGEEGTPKDSKFITRVKNFINFYKK